MVEQWRKYMDIEMSLFKLFFSLVSFMNVVTKNGSYQIFKERFKINYFTRSKKEHTHMNQIVK